MTIEQPKEELQAFLEKQIHKIVMMGRGSMGTSRCHSRYLTLGQLQRQRATSGSKGTGSKRKEEQVVETVKIIIFNAASLSISIYFS
jgi:hypothetical protein